MNRRALLIVAVLAACSKPQSKTDTNAVRVTGTGRYHASIEVPAATTDAAQAHIDRLRGALVRRDPSGKAEVFGREGAKGKILSAAFILSLEHSPGYTQGASLTTVAGDMKNLFDNTAAQRQVVATFDEDRGQRHIDVEFSIGQPPAQTRMRSRLFITDRLYEVGCQCLGDLCSALGSCVLPEPPADALAIDQPTPQ